jgi:hypothetical protein
MLFPKQLIKLAFALKRPKFIATPDMEIPDKDLRNGHPSVRSFDHFVAALPIAANVDLGEGNAFPLQQGFC